MDVTILWVYFFSICFGLFIADYSVGLFPAALLYWLALEAVSQIFLEFLHYSIMLPANKFTSFPLFMPFAFLPQGKSEFPLVLNRNDNYHCFVADPRRKTSRISLLSTSAMYSMYGWGNVLYSYISVYFYHESILDSFTLFFCHWGIFFPFLLSVRLILLCKPPLNFLEKFHLIMMHCI